MGKRLAVENDDGSVEGVKTFASFPITPSSAPTTDYQVANKKYVDDNAGGSFTDPMTTRGDIIYKDSSNVTNRLPLGTSGQVLTSDGTDASWTTPSSGGSVGGLYGINVETLTADKTLVAGTDSIYQYLDPNGANKKITLDTASATAGDRFIIQNNDYYTHDEYLSFYQSTSFIGLSFAGSFKKFIFDGTNWVSSDDGNGDGDGSTKINRNNLAIGYNTRGYAGGVALGYSAQGYTNGVSVGNSSNGYSSGVGIGRSATGITNGVAIGYSANGSNRGTAVGYESDTNGKYYAIAKGYYSKCERYGEEWKCADHVSSNKYGYGQLDWYGSTTDNTQTEIYLQGTASNRAILIASSAYSFKLNIIAYDNTNVKGKVWEIKGGIKRDASSNTSLIGSISKTTISEDANTTNWDITIEADDTNEALIVKVTGDTGETIRWNVEGSISECRF